MALKVPETFQDIFFTYEWSSMVLNVITTAIVHALERGSVPVQKAWLETGLHSKLMSTWMENADVSWIEICPHPTFRALLSCVSFDLLRLVSPYPLDPGGEEQTKGRQYGPCDRSQQEAG